MGHRVSPTVEADARKAGVSRRGAFYTTVAPLAYRHEEQLLPGADWETVYREQVLPAKLAIDLDYMARRSLWSDLGLIVRTIAAVLR